MASLPKREDVNLMLEADKPHFFKIILQDSIRGGKLGIPKKFAIKYGDKLPSSIFLKVPTGAKWRVELIKCDGEVWFKNGWQEFVEYYSLAHGSFLVFQYDKKNCHFNVIIFDKSASEIDYPYNNLEKEFQEPKSAEETQTDVSAEIFDGFSTSRKARQKSPLPFSQPHKKMKVDNSTRNDKATEGNEEQRLDGVMVRKQSLTAEEKANSLQRANINFKSENPFFIIAMQPSYVHPGKKLAIPNAFSRKYFKQKRGAAALSTFEGKTWSAEFYYIVHKGRTSAKLLNGWKKFAQENHLEVGDVCAFELINQTKITFKITIFRHDQGNKKQPVGEKSNSREKFIQEYPSCSNLCVAIKAAKEFTSIHPFFKAVITASHLGRANVHVPHDFLSEMQQSKEKAKLQVGNRRWDVKLNLYANKMKHRGVLSAGWCQFARENSVQVGDVCVFELIDNQAVVMKVSIFRNVQ